jgi:hypothetical protein
VAVCIRCGIEDQQASSRLSRPRVRDARRSVQKARHFAYYSVVCYLTVAASHFAIGSILSTTGGLPHSTAAYVTVCSSMHSYIEGSIVLIVGQLERSHQYIVR